MNTLNFENDYKDNIPSFSRGDIIHIKSLENIRLATDGFYMLSFMQLHPTEAKRYDGVFQLINLNNGDIFCEKNFYYSIRNKKQMVTKGDVEREISQRIYDILNSLSLQWQYIGPCTINFKKKV